MVGAFFRKLFEYLDGIVTSVFDFFFGLIAALLGAVFSGIKAVLPDLTIDLGALAWLAEFMAILNRFLPLAELILVAHALFVAWVTKNLGFFVYRLFRGKL